MLKWIRSQTRQSAATGSLAQRCALPANRLCQWRKAPWLTPAFSSAISSPLTTRPRNAHRPAALHAHLHALIACVVITACLALTDRTLAQETASAAKPQASTSEPATSQPRTGATGQSEAILRVIALRQALEAEVKALARIAAYQKELLDLAKTSDREAVLRARRQRQTCQQELGATALCDALSASFTDENLGEDRGRE